MRVIVGSPFTSHLLVVGTSKCLVDSEGDVEGEPTISCLIFCVRLKFGCAFGVCARGVEIGYAPDAGTPHLLNLDLSPAKAIKPPSKY